MRNLIYPVALTLFLIIPNQAFPAVPVSKSFSLGLNSIEKMKPNGEYVVEVFRDDKWQEAGRLSFDQFYRDRELNLGEFISGSGPVRIRVSEKGGGAAHIDSISLGGLPPADVKTIDRDIRSFAPQYGNNVLRKISGKDYDVVDAFEKTFELTFNSSKNPMLHLTARVEPVIIGQTPFQFPPQNLYRPMNEHAHFYRYNLGSEKGGLKMDGSLEELAGEKPFFKEFSRTGTGHPSGFTYGWVRNDEENLYVAIDFTPDDTYDGDKDYAKIYVKTGDSFKEFKVSVPETKWGVPSFTYTDKVPYQHKVYEFRIPLKEIGIEQVQKGKELQLAFAAYGTAGPGDAFPDVAYDPNNNRYLVVYMTYVNIPSPSYTIRGQFVNADGGLTGSEFIISDASGIKSAPRVVYNAVNQQYLVVWHDYRSGNYDIYGQLVNVDGVLLNTTSNANLAICTEVHDQYSPSVAYDNFNGKYLVAWQDYRSGTNYDIYGQLVYAIGTLFNVNFIISGASNNQMSPSVAYDSVYHRLLTVWQDYRSGSNNDIYGQVVNAFDGNLIGSYFIISNATANQGYPSVTYDSANQRFLAVWQDQRNGLDIYGQLINANSTLYSTASDVNLPVSTAANTQTYPSVTYDSFNQRFLAVWEDFRGGLASDIYGEGLNADGSYYEIPVDTNFVISDAASYQQNPRTAYNSFCVNFLTAYSTTEAGPVDIGLSLLEYDARKVVGVPPLKYFISLTEAFSEPLSDGDIIDVRAKDLGEDPGLVYGQTSSITLRGGFNFCYLDNEGGYTTIRPSLSIDSGQVIVENIIIQ